MISSPDLSARVAAHARKRVEKLKRERPVEALRSAPLYSRTPRPLAAIFEKPQPWVGEVVFAIPPKGFLGGTPPTAAEAVRRAAVFLVSGAAAVSVHVERNFHAGDVSHFAASRAAYPEALLIMRDCVVDEYQLELARAEGADGVILNTEAAGLRPRAEALGLTAIAEGVGEDFVLAGAELRFGDFVAEWRING